jgi:hypothetical protein
MRTTWSCSAPSLGSCPTSANLSRSPPVDRKSKIGVSGIGRASHFAIALQRMTSNRTRTILFFTDHEEINMDVLLYILTVYFGLLIGTGIMVKWFLAHPHRTDEEARMDAVHQ